MVAIFNCRRSLCGFSSSNFRFFSFTLFPSRKTRKLSLSKKISFAINLFTFFCYVLESQHTSGLEVKLTSWYLSWWILFHFLWSFSSAWFRKGVWFCANTFFLWFNKPSYWTNVTNKKLGYLSQTNLKDLHAVWKLWVLWSFFLNFSKFFLSVIFW